LSQRGRTAVAAVNGLFGELVHESARSDAAAFARQRAFIAAHVAGAVLSIFAFGIFFLTVGAAGSYALIALAWFLTPLLIALFLSRTGNLEVAHFLSAANLIGLVTIAAALTGGIGSFAIVWMIVVPLEASLSSSRTMVVWSTLAAALALVFLYAGSVLAWFPAPLETGVSHAARGLFSHLAAACYAGALALSIEALHAQAAAEVTASRERYRLLAENATDLITRHDAGGAILFASPASRLIAGEPAEALLGHGLLDRILVSDRPRYLQALARAATEGGPIEEEFRLRRQPAHSAEAHFIWVEMRCSRVPAAGLDAGSRGEVVAVTRDVSRRKAQELELIEARNAAERANRAKTLFLANMSHELRTPLNAIIGFSDIMKGDLGKKAGEARNLDYVTIIHDSGSHLLQVVNDLLDVSKIESGNYRIVPEPFDLAPLVASCCATVRPAASSRSISVVLRIEEELPELEADRRAVKQMLLNLLANAVKFSNEGGRVEAAARLIEGGSTVLLTVADNGIGIAAADIARLGQPFVQAESGYARRSEGTGLGLSVVKGLARLHGGSLEIESELGKGTTVSVRLPLVAVEQPEYGAAGNTVPMPARTSMAVPKVVAA
jgi:cell cycle sensor histidine kinase DivJ